jgi:4-hydroxy-3-methylbut-2-enyl diphosphate reductase IspH
VRDAVGRAHNVADEIRMAAKRDAQEIVNTTCARIRRQLGDAEAMAVEILGTAEFKALEIERDGVSTEATESAAVMARAPGEPAAATTAEDAQQLVLLAVARMQRTLQALDELGEVVSTRAAEMLATAMAVESVLQTEKASPKVWGRSGVDETSSGHRRIDGHTRANGHPVRLESVDLDDRS